MQTADDDVASFLGRVRIGDTVDVDGRPAAVRLLDVFDAGVADSLLDTIRDEVEFERDDIGEQKRTSRRRPGPSPARLAPLALFSSHAFLALLADVVGNDVVPLREPAVYRLDDGDFIAPHHDRTNPFTDVSVAYNLTRGWTPGDGGETVVGAIAETNVVGFVDGTDEPLLAWSLRAEEHVFEPVFNSALILLLDDGVGHAVRTVHGSARFSVTTLYTSA